MGRSRRPAPESDVARWHRLSGRPDNLTDEDEIVRASPGLRQQVEKDTLRGEIARLRAPGVQPALAALARLAASYLLAGDVETARRYVAQARDLEQHDGASGSPGAEPPEP